MHLEKQQRSLESWQTFVSTSVDTRLKQAIEADGQAKALELFHEVAATVPAYKGFLQARAINPDSIQTFTDFQSLPLTTKQNYWQSNSLAHLCRNGSLESCDLIAVSSGSTGQPTFWPRSISDEFQIATRFEQVFRDSFQAERQSTLAVVCFPLGTWVGGIYTASCCRHLAAKGYPLTTITPGNNKAEILRVVLQLAPMFEQVVLLGYPPFLKDVIDSAIAQGVEWSRYSIKLVMAGEVFSEEWRTLVGERVGSSNPCYDSASLYGTADAGVLGHETPLSISIRRFLANNPKAAHSLFGEFRLPTLVQYDPTSRFFETVDGTLLLSGDNGIPLVRYQIGDTGGLISYPTMLKFLKGWGFDPLDSIASFGSRGVPPLPFVYVFGRSHFTVSYFGANVYPENIAVGLEQPSIRDWVSGKFVMEVKEDCQGNFSLLIIVELASDVETSSHKQETVALSIREQLLRLNSEFANYVPPESQLPQVVLAPLGEPEYFPLGTKHRYTRQSRL